MSITDQQFDQLRQAVAADDHQRFERLVEQIVVQAIRERLARREASRPVRQWIPEYV